MNIPNSWQYNNNAADNNTSANPIATFLNQEPERLKASENIITFGFQARNFNTSARKAKMTIRVNGNVAAGQTLTIESSVGFKISFKSSNTPSYNEFWTEASSFNVPYRTRVAESIASEMSNNLNISNYYNVQAIGVDIIVEAKEFGSIYSILPISTVTGLTLLLPQTNAGENRFINENFIDYSLFVDVYTTDTVIGQIVNKADTNGSNPSVRFVDRILIPFSGNELDSKTPINVNGLVGQFVDVQLPRVTSMATNIQFNTIDLNAINNQQTPISNQYFLIYGDSYRYTANGDRKYRTQGQSSVLAVQNACFDVLKYYTLSDYIFDYTLTSPFKFLSDCPNVSSGVNWLPNIDFRTAKEVSYSAIEFLQYIQVYNEIGSITNRVALEVECYFNDGTSSVFDRFDSTGWLAPMGKGGNISIDVSPNALGLQGIESSNGKVIEYYTIRMFWNINDTTNRYYSQYRAYKLNRICNEAPERIIWFNSLGGWDSIEMSGNSSFNIDVDKTTIQTTIPFDANTFGSLSVELNKTLSVNAKESYTMSTGFVDISQYKWLSSLVKSSSVFILDVRNGGWSSIQITGFDYSYNNLQNTFSMTITYQLSSGTNTIAR
jgi:hypothetical protein